MTERKHMKEEWYIEGMGKLLRALRDGVFLERAYIKLKSYRRRTYLPYMFEPQVLPVEVVYVEPHLGKQDVDIVKRLLRAFNKARHDEPTKNTRDLWDGIQANIHADFFAICDDPEKVAHYLAYMNQHGISHGISASSKPEYEDMRKYRKVRREWGSMVQEIFNRYGGDVPHTFDDGAMYKLKVGDTLLDYRDIWAAYTASRLKELKATSVAEIGAGMGKATYHATRLGIPYATYDLPLMNLVQGWYLIKSGVSVALYGEWKQRAAVRVLPYWLYDGKVDVTLNVDSFPEMATPIVRDYVEKAQNSRLLVSINQEDAGAGGPGSKPVIVPDIVTVVGGFIRLERNPYYLRKGYMEEVYATVSKTPAPNQ